MKKKKENVEKEEEGRERSEVSLFIEE